MVDWTVHERDTQMAPPTARQMALKPVAEKAFQKVLSKGFLKGCRLVLPSDMQMAVQKVWRKELVKGLQKVTS
jgi:hypothetical protein